MVAFRTDREVEKYLTQYGSRDGHGFPLLVNIKKSEIILSVCGVLSSNSLFIQEICICNYINTKLIQITDCWLRCCIYMYVCHIFGPAGRPMHKCNGLN